MGLIISRSWVQAPLWLYIFFIYKGIILPYDKLIDNIDYNDYYNNCNERKIKIRIIENKTHSIFSGNNNAFTNMSHMFYGFSSLSYLPDISKWNTNKVTNMSHMF